MGAQKLAPEMPMFLKTNSIRAEFDRVSSLSPSVLSVPEISERDKYAMSSLDLKRRKRKFRSVKVSKAGGAGLADTI
jgi:hypothetical protein